MMYLSRLIFLSLFTIFISDSVFAADQLKGNFTYPEKFGEELPDQSVFKVWKNETLPLILKIHSSKEDPVNIEIEMNNAKVSVLTYQLAYVRGDFSAGSCGSDKINNDFASARFPDRSVPITNNIIQPDSVIHYVLIHLTVDEKAKKGSFPLNVKLQQNGQSTDINAKIEIQNQKLPDFQNLDYKVDFWQYPLVVSNYHNVKPYGQEHMQQLDVMFKQLQYINQKVITTSVFWDLYNTSIKPLEEMMIQVSKKTDGTYSYDYSNFEKYVNCGLSNGIDEQISVHNLYPWNNYFFYYDEAKKKVVSVQTLPLSDDYKNFWSSFLKDFNDYLSQKGWLEKVVFYIDEREVGQSLGVAKFIKEINPDFKIGYAGRFYKQLSPYIYDYSVPTNVVMEDVNLQSRMDTGQETTFYTSCFEKQPNMLMMSNYGDIYFLTMLAKAKGYDGMLRWAFNLWSSQIKENAIYTDVPSGDAHFVYPDGQVSLRYWIIRDALEETLKFDVKKKDIVAKQVLNAHTRYFLLNVEASRLDMVSTMKKYLND